MTKLTLQAPAKVNLYLRVGPRRADGYHDLDTVFHAVALSDTITITPASAYALTCDVDLGVEVEQNIVTRAVRAMEHEFERDARVAVSVTKRIPHGAGLGGGSSDAAATILGLAHLWHIDPKSERVLEVARTIGADVPFFLTTAAGAFTGRGDVLDRPLPALRSALVIVKVPDHVSTADAYAALDAGPKRSALGHSRAIRDAMRFGDVADVARHMENDFTPVIGERIPPVLEVLEELRGSDGVFGAEMSGSGSAVFALVAADEVATRLAAAYHRRGLFSHAGRLSLTGARIVAEERS